MLYHIVFEAFVEIFGHRWVRLCGIFFGYWHLKTVSSRRIIITLENMLSFLAHFLTLLLFRSLNNFMLNYLREYLRVTLFGLINNFNLFLVYAIRVDLFFLKSLWCFLHKIQFINWWFLVFCFNGSWWDSTNWDPLLINPRQDHFIVYYGLRCEIFVVF